MASGALFGGSTGRSASKNLVEFRAGKMYMKGKMVHPDKRKGLVSIYQSDDSLMHFCWTDRTKGSVEDDLIIFPDDVEFKHVKQCTTGRVYLLKFKNMTRRMFFWMQEPKTEKDEEHMNKVNELLNNPPTPGSSGRGAGAGLGSGGLPPDFASTLGGDSDLQSLLGNMSQQQLMQLLGGMGMGGMGSLSALMGGRPSSATSDSAPPSRVQSSPGPRTTSSETLQTQRPVTAAALPSQSPSASSSNTSNQSGNSGTTGTTETAGATTASESSSATSVQSGIQLSDLQNILSGMGAAAQAPKESVDLSAAITPESMIPLLANKDIQEKLIPHLPEGESLPQTEDELRNTISTPQFQQAMQSFSAALASGQLGPLMGQFKLGDQAVAAANAGDVEAFAKAMQPDKKDEKKDEKMEEDKKE